MPTQVIDDFGFSWEDNTSESATAGETVNITTQDEASQAQPLSLLPTSYVDVEAQQAAELAKTNLDFLAGIALPEIYRYAFPPVYLAIWAWILEYIHKTRDFSQLAIGLPRGFGKTLVIKLVILYAILFTNKRFIIVFSETEDKAISILSDVMDMLNEHNIKALFGDWSVGKIIDQQVKKVFGFRGRTIILKAAGAGTGIRGITEKNLTP
jgi:hypothetical protein